MQADRLMLARGVRHWLGDRHSPAWVKRWSSRRPALPGFEADDLYMLALVYSLAGVLLAVAIGTDEAGQALYQYVPKGIWIVALVAGAALVVWGLVGRWHRPVWLGHGLLATAYSSLCVGLVSVAPARAVVYLSLFAPFAVVHWWTWVRLGFTAPDEEEGDGGP